MELHQIRWLEQFGRIGNSHIPRIIHEYKLKGRETSLMPV
jgi:hypothetical protein